MIIRLLPLFPTRLHLWLLALGVQVRFTRKRCPTDHAIIERTHQTMTAQTLLGQTYTSHTALWAGLDERLEVLNHHLPSLVLAHKAPLEAYPQAIHSGRSYHPEWEEELLSLEKVCSYLAQGRWFRSIRSNGFFGLGGHQYYLGKHFAQHPDRCIPYLLLVRDIYGAQRSLLCLIGKEVLLCVYSATATQA